MDIDFVNVDLNNPTFNSQTEAELHPKLMSANRQNILYEICIHVMYNLTLFLRQTTKIFQSEIHFCQKIKKKYQRRKNLLKNIKKNSNSTNTQKKNY